MVKGYFGYMKIHFTVDNQKTKCPSLEIGIVTGCKVSVIHFAVAMNLLIKSVEKNTMDLVWHQVKNNHQLELSWTIYKWMTAVDKSKLPGKYKTWIHVYQHGVLPQLQTVVEELERVVSGGSASYYVLFTMCCLLLNTCVEKNQHTAYALELEAWSMFFLHV